LSSIEIVIVDQVESFIMQNWDHLKVVFEKLNNPPNTIKKDIRRLRLTSIDNQAKNLRYFSSYIIKYLITLVFSSTSTTFPSSYY
jgi:hypothetical protein